MPLKMLRNLSFLPDPVETHIEMVALAFVPIDEVARVEFGVWTSRAARDAGLPMADRVVIDIPKVGAPAVEEVLDEQGNVVTPGAPAVLSYGQFKAAFPQLFRGVVGAVEAVALTLHQFEGAESVPS